MHHSPKPWDVFVVGGGPAGLATAIAARRHGLSVAVADAAAPPIDKSCGEGLMPDGVVALETLALDIPKAGFFPFRGIRFVSNGIAAEAEFPRGTAFGIRRTWLHQWLTEQAEAAGARLLWRTAVTGLDRDGVLVAGDRVHARWIVGADGVASRVRNWAGLGPADAGPAHSRKVRYGFRRHYHLQPWTSFMELHWGRNCQIYVTPIAAAEVCIAMVSSNQRLRLDEALQQFPELNSRLGGAAFSSSERGAITLTRRLHRVYRGNTVLVGDASGSVDAITGEGLCLGFRQAAVLGECLASGDMGRYQKQHRALLRRPALMADLMLLLARHSSLRQRTMKVFRSSPRAFAAMLAMHVGHGNARSYVGNGLTLGWKLLRPL